MFLIPLLSLILSLDPIWVDGEAIVSFRSKLVETAPGTFELPPSLYLTKDRFGFYDIEPLLQGRMDEMDTQYGLDRAYILRFDPSENVKDFVAQVSLSPDVEIAEPNYLYRLFITPDDPLFPSQWFLYDIKAPQGWEIQKGSPNVVIAVVDAGIDTAHPDLNANLWRNPGEVLDGIDNDGNGYIDDIVGWDWTKGDNDPTPTYFGFPGWPPDEDHGTWCNSIANAVTNNTTGVAGVAWNVQMMGMRTTAWRSPGHISTDHAVSAIHYARVNGAHVISCSWGGNRFSHFVNNAIQQAHHAGLVIVAAAGNDNSSARHYPAAYDNVIAVGGTEPGNRKWGSSNYGTWVDVCAPAAGIYGCDTDGTGSDLYESPSGTSGSAPQVAGLAALLFSKYPDSSNIFIENRIFETSVPIDDTLYEQGKLGHGKINMFKALGIGDYSWPVLYSFTICDSIGGNNNGRPEPGEICRLIISLTNQSPWSDARNLTVQVSSLEPAIRFIDSTALFPNVTSVDTVENRDAIVFEVLDMSPAWVTFTITYISATPSPYPESDTLSPFLVDFPLLLVDDDKGALYEVDYINALNTLGIVYEYWTIELSGNPAGKLLSHPLVVWFTGDDSVTTLTTDERTSLAGYLDQGGKLFLTGQNIAQDIAGEAFLGDYLKSSFVSPSLSGNFVIGRDGDEVGDGLNILTGLNQDSRDVITPLPGADTVLLYDATSCAGIKYRDGERAVVFFSFGLEGVIDHVMYSSTADIMERVISWLDPTIGVEEDVEAGLVPARLDLYPNPASSVITFAFSAGATPSLVKIYDIAGREIDSFIARYERFEYNIRALSPGIYFYRATTSFSGEKNFGKFIVIR